VPGRTLARGACGDYLEACETNVISQGLALAPALLLWLSFLAQCCAAAAGPRVEAESAHTVVGRAACPHLRLPV